MSTLLLGSLGSVLGASLGSTVHPQRVVAATNNVVPDAGKVTDSAATNQNDRVLLKVVSFAADIGGDFLAIREANTSDLSKCRVWLLRSHCADLQAHASFLRTCRKVTDIGLGLRASSGLANELVDRGHGNSVVANQASRVVYQDGRFWQGWRVRVEPVAALSQASEALTRPLEGRADWTDTDTQVHVISDFAEDVRRLFAQPTCG